MSEIADYSPLWGKWHIKELLGKGSFGCVYRAEKTEFGNTYVSAVKHLKIPPEGTTKEMLVSEGLIARTSHFSQYCDRIRDDIIKEINTCYALRGNSNIVSYEDHEIIPSKDGIGYDIFIRMEYLVSLPKFMNYHVFTEEDVIRLGIEMCNALTILQKHQILHRDIKPANIFISSLGEFKLGDFGEAKMLSGTTVGMSVRGTYTYMAPEIFRGKPANITADLYSLGIVLYRLLNGNKAPFVPLDAVTTNSQMIEIANNRRFSGERIPLPCYCQNQRLIDIIMRACEFDPKNRWQTPEEMQAALMELQQRKEQTVSGQLPKVVMKEKPSVVSGENSPETLPPMPAKQKMVSESGNGSSETKQNPVSFGSLVKPSAQDLSEGKKEGVSSKGKKKLPFRKRVLIIPTAVILLGAMILTTVLIIQNVDKDNQYQAYLSELSDVVDESTRVDNCKKAIDLIPTRAEAYLALLQTYVDCGLDDYKYIQDSDKDSSSMSVFDEYEYVTFKTISNLATQEGPEYLTKEFGEKVYYPIAEALLFRTEQNASPRATEAIVWLEKAKICSLTGEIKQTVDALYEFSRNYQEANTSKENMSFRDYRSYWDQLMKIEEFVMYEFQNGSHPSDIMTVQCLNLCVYEIEKKMSYFKTWGDVTEHEMSYFIAKIEDDIKLLTPLLSVYDSGSVIEEFKTLSEFNIGALKSKFEEVYHGYNAEKTEDD